MCSLRWLLLCWVGFSSMSSSDDRLSDEELASSPCPSTFSPRSAVASPCLPLPAAPDSPVFPSFSTPWEPMGADGTYKRDLIRWRGVAKCVVVCSAPPDVHEPGATHMSSMFFPFLSRIQLISLVCWLTTYDPSSSNTTQWPELHIRFTDPGSVHWCCKLPSWVINGRVLSNWERASVR